MPQTRGTGRALVASGLLVAGCGGMDPVTMTSSPPDMAAPPDQSPVPVTDPLRVTLHRLNRVEYNNTVRDLLGTTQTPADDFPSDDRGYGFDNIADVLSLSPLQLELYQHAAELLLDQVMKQPITKAATTHNTAVELKPKIGAAYKTFWNMNTNGSVDLNYGVPQDGAYRLATRAFGQQAGPDPCKMTLSVDGKVLKSFDVTVVEASPAVYELEVTLKAGAHQVSWAFINDYYNAMTKEDRNLVFDWLEVQGPLHAEKLSNPLRDRLVDCDPSSGMTSPADCATRTLKRFAHRAWRRPVTDDEVKSLAGFIDVAAGQGDDFNTGLKLAMEAALVSPHFVFRVEIDPDPTSLKPHPLSDHELAARLSYFLWSTMPDDALLAAADAGMLHSPDQVDAQVVRMLTDPRASALVDNFAGQWLFTRGLKDHVPDYNTFPSYDPALADAMATETELYFSEFLYGEIGIDKLLTADFTFVNDRLAHHYGMPPITGGGFRRMPLGATERRGVLGQGSLLTVTSYPTRTSPVKRGKWVLEQMLCSPPPAPPPGVEGLPQMIDTGTVRQKLEEHRKNPQCAVCHTAMDPIGFGLEHFDGIGAFRTTDNGQPIDATGDLPGSKVKFDGAAQLATELAKDPRFIPCVTQQLMTYALGRGIELADNDSVQRIDTELAKKGYHLSDLIRSIARSDPFRMRRGEPAGGGK